MLKLRLAKIKTPPPGAFPENPLYSLAKKADVRKKSKKRSKKENYVFQFFSAGLAKIKTPPPGGFCDF